MPSSKQVPTALPFIVVFLASTCVMVLELVASLLIAQYVGSNLYTWTSVIAVVLGGLSVGNLIGGGLAQRSRSGRVGVTLAPVLVVSGAVCLAIIGLVGFVFGSAWIIDLNLPVRVLT